MAVTQDRVYMWTAEDTHTLLWIVLDDTTVAVMEQNPGMSIASVAQAGPAKVREIALELTSDAEEQGMWVEGPFFSLDVARGTLARAVRDIDDPELLDQLVDLIISHGIPTDL